MRQLLILIGFFALAGCIEKEDTRSFYLHEDGKVDAVVLLDAVHSSDKGEAARKEEKEWLAEFRKGTAHELKQLKDSHARKVSPKLLRAEPPYAAMITASFATTQDFGKFFDLSTTDPAKRIEFHKNGKKRTLVFHLDKEKPHASPSPSTEETPRIHWRFIPIGGVIRSARSCVVAKDSSSCLLDIAEIMRKEPAEGVDFAVEWELN